MKFKSDIQAESKVGIGIATPIYDLDVSGVIRASKGFIDNTFTSDDTVRIVSPANATYTVAAAGETGAIKIVPPIAVYGGTTGTSTKVSFKVNISDGVVIQISGTFSRPGVGITDVWTALSVTTISNASTDNNYTITGDGSGSAAIWIGSSTDSQASLKGIWVTDCQVSGGIGGLSGGLPQAIAWDISINASVPTGFGTFLANNTQVTNWKRNGQKLYYGSGSGNVGIGTSSPSELLHLSSTGPARLLIQADTDNVTETDNAQIILKQDGGFVVGNLGYKTNTNGLEITNQYVGVDGILTFGTSNAERMRISDLGAVGIGTIGPNSKLEVAGEIDATTGDGYKINGKPWANQNANVLNLGDWDGEGFSTIIYDENSRGVVKIKDYGTMINCSSLSSSYGSRASLAVGTVGNENAGAAVITLSNNDTTSSAGDPTGAINFAIKADNGAGSLGYTSAIISGSIFQTAGLGNPGGGILDFKTSPSSAGASPQTRIRINQLGDVGIGTTSPDAKLEVSSSSGGVLRLTSSDTSVATGESIGRVEFKSNDASTGGSNIMGFVDCLATNAGTTYALTFGTGNAAAATEKMRIEPSGNVGINDTTPSYKLDVSGEGRFTGDLRCLSLIQTSQSDKKEFISDIVKTTNKKIEFKEYVYKSDSGNRKRYGVLAEDIEVDYPELVHVDADGVKGVNYIDLLVKRVAELEKELEDISLTEGPKGDTGSRGLRGYTGTSGSNGSSGTNGADGKDGKDGNSHLSDVSSIGFNEKSGQLEIRIGRETYRFNQDK